MKRGERRMPRGNGSSPRWGGGPGSGRGAGRFFAPQSSNSSKTGESRIEKYTAFIEALIPLVAGVSSLVKLLKKPKALNPLNKTSVEPEDSENLERGDPYAER